MAAHVGAWVRGAGTDRRAVRWRLEEDWSDAFRPPQMQKPPPDRAGVSGLGSLTITYFHTGIRTIIGVESFHGPVRDGKGWDRLAMVIRQRGLLRRFAAQPIGKKQ
ncbi:hypothetical protein BMULJ_05087 [Burkholderia multivorans ATCC 17616]|uniref:Uncharacterized protein n=1 Tax=Burkholderia multivorans (strain ATCC 17616 / 249) TaxID=395019 RepID=A0A0H3KTH3_BURM1|nr:hypothetical protein BMULJ_05087 [Burkholderia multivorans ATCC 17616]